MLITREHKKLFEKRLIDLETTKIKIAEKFGISSKSITRILSNKAGNKIGSPVHEAKCYIVELIKESETCFSLVSKNG